MNDIFKLVEVNKHDVIIEVKHYLQTLDIARNPYVDSTMAYINVTRGRDHDLTVIKHDGTWGATFCWGASGCTLVGANLARLRDEVQNFIKENNIDIEVEG